MIENFCEGFCVRLCNSMSGHEQMRNLPMPHPTTAITQPSSPAEMMPLRWCPLLSPALPDTESAGRVLCAAGLRSHWRANTLWESGRNPSAASLRFVAHAKGWGERWKDWGYTHGPGHFMMLHEIPLLKSKVGFLPLAFLSATNAKGTALCCSYQVPFIKWTALAVRQCSHKARGTKNNPRPQACCIKIHPWLSGWW